MSHCAPPELIIFDCDGVLVDSERVAAEIGVQLLARYGMNVTVAETIERFMGRSEGLIFTTIEQHIGRPLTEAELRAMDSLYVDDYDARLEPVPGVTEALAQITLPICVASSSKPEGLRRKLTRCGLIGHFEDAHIFSATQVRHGKPAPDLFLFAAATLGVEPSRCVVVEDSPYGVQAARAAGIPALAYLGGMIPAERLEGPGTTLFDDMLELPSLIATAR